MLRMAKTRRRFRRSIKRSADVLTQLLASISAALTRPQTLIVTIFAAIITVSVSKNETNNLLTDWAATLIANDVTKPLGSFIQTHILPTTGFILHLVPISTTRYNQFIYFLFSIFICFYTRAATLQGYLARTFFLLAFVIPTSRNVKIILAIIVVVLYKYTTLLSIA